MSKVPISYPYVDRQPIKITTETQKLTGCTWLNTGRVWDLDITQYFHDQCKKVESPIIFDVGAQTGSFTLISKFLPKTAQMYGFEPLPASFKCLQDNLELNELGSPRAQVYNCGLSNVVGETVLKVPDHKGLCTMGENPLRFRDYESVNVQTDTIDHFCEENNVNGLDFMKIDTEGWEYFVLRGGVNTIKRYKPEILMEWNAQNMEQCGVNKDVFMRFITDELGYTVQKQFRDDIYIVTGHSDSIGSVCSQSS